MKLYEISQNMLQLQQAMEENPELDVSEILEGYEGAFESKAENIVKLIRSLEAEQKALKDEQNYLKERANKVKKQAENLMNYLDTNMKASNKEKLQAGVFELAYKKNPMSVEIVDMKKIPAAYKQIKTEVKVDKNKLKKDYKDSEQAIDGVTFIDDKYTLKIK